MLLWSLGGVKAIPASLSFTVVVHYISGRTLTFNDLTWSLKSCSEAHVMNLRYLLDITLRAMVTDYLVFSCL